ncbi:MAG TPA: alpha-amylase family glycosyl hydrolase [Solirubrobacteraceae bacterium]|nr:alpha-amylase family glycosyl hydrolase [Solirubrobacteraceae bacterium]
MAGAPAWWQRGAIYHIYPRSFADADGDGIGDLAGIAAHLDHVSELGFEAVWLSPFYRSPMADFGYDVADYRDVDPIFGTLEDFDRLVEAAHARGIRVVVDWVPNHSSDRHEWFIESRASRDSPKRDWYVWRDGAAGGGPPNDWMSEFPAVGPAWTFDEATEQWYLHSFLAEQPDLNWDNPEVETAMHDVLRFWLERGVDGFRIDALQRLAHDPLLRSNGPGAPRRHDQDWETMADRVRGIRRVVDEYEDRMIVGEVALLDLHRIVSYLNTGDQLHLAHNFVFAELPWDAEAFRVSVDDFEALAEDHAWPAWFLSNHDKPRVASRFDEGGQGPARARAALLLLYALRGTPFVYQGEELGLPDAEIPPDRVVDVDGRDPQRAPIPWRPPSQAGPGAGFTTGEPWLPIVAAAEELNAQTQAADLRSTLHLTRRLAALRRDMPVLQTGAQRSLDAHPDVFALVRDGDGERVLVAINFAAVPVPAELPAPVAGAGALLMSTDPDRAAGDVRLATLELGPAEGVVVRL